MIYFYINLLLSWYVIYFYSFWKTFDDTVKYPMKNLKHINEFFSFISGSFLEFSSKPNNIRDTYIYPYPKTDKITSKLNHHRTNLSDIK